MKKSDVGSALFFIILGGFMAWQAAKLSIGSPRMPGPGFFPFCLSIFLIIVALIILLRGLKLPPRVQESGQKWGRVTLALVAIFVYALVLETLGYLISTFVLMVLLLNMMGKRSWWFAPTVSAIITLASYILFKVWLEVLLPRGWIGF